MMYENRLDLLAQMRLSAAALNAMMENQHNSQGTVFVNSGFWGGGGGGCASTFGDGVVHHEPPWVYRPFSPRKKGAYIGKVTPKPGFIRDGNDVRPKVWSDYSRVEKFFIWWAS